jgi:hypothetical protein
MQQNYVVEAHDAPSGSHAELSRSSAGLTPRYTQSGA